MPTEKRSGQVERTTRETSVQAEMCLDGQGEADIDTGVGFLDHLLEMLAAHGLFDLTVKATGDLHVDSHHTVEDVGIVLGKAFNKALGDKAGIRRFAHCSVPMEEALAAVSVDIGGRSHLSYMVPFKTTHIGDFDVELIQEFFQAFCRHSQITLHIEVIRGENSHHIAESMFKASARTLRRAASIDPRSPDKVPSTKGKL